MEAFRTILVPKVARSGPSGPGGGADAPTGSQGRPQSSHLEPKVGPATLPECQNGPPWGPWGDFGLPLGGFWGALGAFWGHCGHFWASAWPLLV